MLLAFKLGQIVPFMLLGLVGFLYFVRRKQWWLAGMMTVFIAIKPHTLYLFWFAMLLWVGQVSPVASPVGKCDYAFVRVTSPAVLQSSCDQPLF